MKAVFEYFLNEEAYGDFHGGAAVERLSAAVRCNTVTAAPEEGAFEGLREIIKAGYPHVMTCGSFEVLRNCVLITIPGTDASLNPALFMAHMDVVPVVSGTEKDWAYAPFSGAVAEGYVWGRGTEDIKQQVFGTLEAAEYLLSKGGRPRRTLILAYGDDEETLNTGSRMICEHLREKGIRLEFLLDEGGGHIYEAGDFGAPGVIVSDINLMEKGYADLELSVESKGGHSSNPFGGTSLAVLSRAIAAVCDNPFPVKMNSLLRRAFAELKDDITAEPFKTMAETGFADEQALAECCAQVKGLFPYVTTTIAPTVIEGGSQACNVMPQNMRAVINFRIAEGCTPEEVLEHCRKAISDERVRLRFQQSNPPSEISNTDSLGYRELLRALYEFYDGVKFIPLATAGATDARSYEPICDVCLRCSPFIIPPEDAGGVHGTNERISIRSYIHGIKVIISFMEKTVF